MQKFVIEFIIVFEGVECESVLTIEKCLKDTIIPAVLYT